MRGEKRGRRKASGRLLPCQTHGYLPLWLSGSWWFLQMHNPHEVIVCELVGPEAAEGCRRPVGSEEEEEEKEEEEEEEGEAEERGAPAIAGCWQGLLVLLACACG